MDCEDRMKVPAAAGADQTTAITAPTHVYVRGTSRHSSSSVCDPQNARLFPGTPPTTHQSMMLFSGGMSTGGRGASSWAATGRGEKTPARQGSISVGAVSSVK